MYGNNRHHGRGGGHRGQDRMMGRSLVRMMQPAMLILLNRGPVHGYALMDQLTEEFSIPVMNPNQVYRALRHLEGVGAIESDWDQDESQGPPRRVYRLTSDGHEMLDFWVKDLEETRSILDRILKAYQEDVS
ncbi:MAG: PadR family transcriptional regulator [Anaerolineaceae bacterium]|nr:PadR family transcriptional regulator [Anaerolineaceae bacterium]